VTDGAVARRIAQVMADLARAMQQPGEVALTLQAVTACATDSIESADYASISVRHGDGRLETLAPTDALVRRVDLLQFELSEGPCYDAVEATTVTLSDDLARDDGRWPAYGPRVAALGLRSQLGIRLASDDGWRVALNLYARRPNAFDSETISLAQMFADQAAGAMGLVRTVQTLNKALVMRETIGQAVGIVMERYAIDPDRAVAFLLRTAQTSNARIQDVAQEIIAGADRRPAGQNE
jgi:GAF domain-containing protein